MQLKQSSSRGMHTKTYTFVLQHCTEATMTDVMLSSYVLQNSLQPWHPQRASRWLAHGVKHTIECLSLSFSACPFCTHQQIWPQLRGATASISHAGFSDDEAFFINSCQILPCTQIRTPSHKRRSENSTNTLPTAASFHAAKCKKACTSSQQFT
jgi:hypothetical protein